MSPDEKKELLQELLRELAVTAQEEGCELSSATCRFSFVDDSSTIELTLEKEEENEDEEA